MESAAEVGGEEEQVEGEHCKDIALAISATAVVRPAIGVTRFSRPENAGMAGGLSGDLVMQYMYACTCDYEKA